MTTNRDTESTPEERQVQESERDLWSEVFRLLDCTRSKPDDQLLEALLNDRVVDEGNVRVLVRMARTYFERDAKERILKACEKFLGVDELNKIMKKPVREDSRQDNFNPNFIDLDAAFARVIASNLFFENTDGSVGLRAGWDVGPAVKLLGVALGGGATVTDDGCQQLWWAIQYYFKNKVLSSQSVLTIVEDPFRLPPVARAILMCVCKVANDQRWGIKDAAGLSNKEAIAFRS